MSTLYGNMNYSVLSSSYYGINTDTAKITIDNDANTIKVDVIGIPSYIKNLPAIVDVEELPKLDINPYVVYRCGEEYYIYNGEKWTHLASVKNIDDVYTYINTIKSELKADISQINDWIAINEVIINNLVIDMKALSERQTQVETKVADFEQSLIALAVQVNYIEQLQEELQTKINDLGNQVQLLTSRIAEIGDKVTTLEEQLIGVIQNIKTLFETKQDKLTAGTNITIDENNVISAENTTYTAGDNITIADNVISAKDTVYSAGTNITIDENNVISAKGKEYKAGDNISIQDDTISAKDTVYTAGANITIDENNVISAQSTEYEAGENITIQDNIISAVDTKYTAGDNITISDDNKITAKDTTYTAGEGISIDENNVISNTRVSAEWGKIQGDIENQTDLIEKFTTVTTLINEEKIDRIQADNVITSAVENVQKDVDSIKELIPTEATKTNQLADKAYVDAHAIGLATETKIGGIYAAPYDSTDENVTTEVKIDDSGKLHNKQITMNVTNETLKIKIGI